MKTTYRVLTLDGGGIRGQLSTTLLRRLDDAIPGWIDKTDLFAGTSIGAILALGMASGKTPDQLDGLFRRYGPTMFRPVSARIPTRLRRFFRARFSAAPLQRFLDDFCGQTLLGDLPKHVLIPALKLDNENQDRSRRRWEPVMFHNFRSRSYNNCRVPVRQVIAYATATPTFFPSAGGFIDGGVTANNPSMIALAYAQERLACQNYRAAHKSVCLLSIGTGYLPQYIKDKKNDWGILQWQKHLIDLMATSNMQLVDRQCRLLLDDRYHRLCPPLPEKIHGYDHGKLSNLVDLGESVDLGQTVGWLRTNWLHPVLPKPRFDSLSVPFGNPDYSSNSPFIMAP